VSPIWSHIGSQATLAHFWAHSWLTLGSLWLNQMSPRMSHVIKNLRNCASNYWLTYNLQLAGSLLWIYDSTKTRGSPCQEVAREPDLVAHRLKSPLAHFWAHFWAHSRLTLGSLWAQPVRCSEPSSEPSKRAILSFHVIPTFHDKC